MNEVPEDLIAARSKWRYDGRARPAFAATPEPGQESVWDYPRPPRIEFVSAEITVAAGDTEVARTRRAARVLETASPPTYYIPAADVRRELFTDDKGSSWCEWKGKARYWTLAGNGPQLQRAAWSYEDPFPEFRAIAGYWSFYPGRFSCRINGVLATPQPGGLYGGWVTPDLAGPFKGEPGTESW